MNMRPLSNMPSAITTRPSSLVIDYKSRSSIYSIYYIYIYIYIYIQGRRQGGGRGKVPPSPETQKNCTGLGKILGEKSMVVIKILNFIKNYKFLVKFL